jgi:hypothetical protein
VVEMDVVEMEAVKASERAAYYRKHRPERAGALLASLLLGLFCLLVVPIYFAFNPIDAATVKFIDGFAIGNVVLFAGESPAGVLLGLLILPVLLLPRFAHGRTSRARTWIAILLSLLFAIGQVSSALFAVTDASIPLFQPMPGCTIITCGLYHTVFHL